MGRILGSIGEEGRLEDMCESVQASGMDILFVAGFSTIVPDPTAGRSFYKDALAYPSGRSKATTSR